MGRVSHKKRLPPHGYKVKLIDVPGAIGYTVYGLAPIPIHTKSSSFVVEPTATGYNLYREGEKL